MRNETDWAGFEVRRLLLMVLPTLTMASGMAWIWVAAAPDTAPGSSVRVAMGVAAVAPLFAALVVRAILPSADLVIVACAGMLVAIGATTHSLLARSLGADGVFYSEIATRYGLFAGAGFAAMAAGSIAALQAERIVRYPFTLLGAALLLTASTLLFGETVNGARLWLQVGPIRFQPSEVARLLIAVFVAVYLYDRRYLVAVPWRVGPVDLPPLPYVLPLAAAVSGAAVVLMFQNDLGMAALVVLAAVTSVVGVLRSRVAIGAAMALLGSAAIGSYVAVDRVRGRFSGWLDPWQAPGGYGFQLVRADFGLAAGGLAGRPNVDAALGVPEVHTDFVLVAVGSQLGLVTSLVVLGLLVLLVCRCVLAALSARDGLNGLLALSLTALVGIQVILIVAGTLRVLPLTGLTVPLVSYGGTSMIVTLFALGLIVGLGADSPRPRVPDWYAASDKS